MAKILVVEDAASTLGALLEFLQGQGYHAIGAGSFPEARRMADEEGPDLLVIDVRLGAYNGMHLLVRERATHPERPVILTTGYPDPLIEAEARSYGAEFLPKPYHPSELLNLIRRMLSPQAA
jgi:DNA-binding response OmpR family regulator